MASKMAVVRIREIVREFIVPFLWPIPLLCDLGFITDWSCALRIISNPCRVVFFRVMICFRFAARRPSSRTALSAGRLSIKKLVGPAPPLCLHSRILESKARKLASSWSSVGFSALSPLLVCTLVHPSPLNFFAFPFALIGRKWLAPSLLCLLPNNERFLHRKLPVASSSFPLLSSISRLAAAAAGVDACWLVARQIVPSFFDERAEIRPDFPLSFIWGELLMFSRSR